MLWRTVGFLSVTLQRQNFLFLSGCVPSLADRVTGIRESAALDAAMQAGVEEFGFPPEVVEQVCGTHFGTSPQRAGGIAEPEDSSLAAGLLRASGMQLGALPVEGVVGVLVLVCCVLEGSPWDKTSLVPLLEGILESGRQHKRCTLEPSPQNGQANWNNNNKMKKNNNNCNNNDLKNDFYSCNCSRPKPALIN